MFCGAKYTHLTFSPIIKHLITTTSNKPPRARAHAHTHTHTHTHTRTHARTHARTPDTHTHARTRIRVSARTHARTHAHTHTHTHKPFKQDATVAQVRSGFGSAQRHAPLRK